MLASVGVAVTWRTFLSARDLVSALYEYSRTLEHCPFRNATGTRPDLTGEEEYRANKPVECRERGGGRSGGTFTLHHAHLDSPSPTPVKWAAGAASMPPRGTRLYTRGRANQNAGSGRGGFLLGTRANAETPRQAGAGPPTLPISADLRHVGASPWRKRRKTHPRCTPGASLKKGGEHQVPGIRRLVVYAVETVKRDGVRVVPGGPLFRCPELPESGPLLRAAL